MRRIARNFEELRSPTRRDVGSIMEIYSASFPRYERAPEEITISRINSGFYRTFIYREKGEVVFFALIRTLTGTEFSLLDYMATKDGLRGRGLGGDFMKTVFGNKEQSRTMVIEVEPPVTGEPGNEASRRVGFYRRCGAKELSGVRYFLPFLNEGRPTEMRLMVLGPGGQFSMSGSVVKRIIRKIYMEVYRRAEDDPVLAAFIDLVPEAVALK